MFRLGGPDRPADGPTLAAAVAAGLGDCLTAGSPAPTVAGDAGLAVDLTGCRFATDRSPFAAAAADAVREPGPAAGDLSVRGAPVTIGGSEFTIDIATRDTGLAYVGDEDTTVLALDRHDGGHARLFLARDELERAVEGALKAKLAGQGAKLLSVGLELESVDERCFEVEVAVLVKMMFKAKVKARGKLRLGDDLTLVVEEAKVDGDGMAGRTFAGLVRPQLVKLAGKEFALGTLLPPGIALADVTVKTDGGLGVDARILPHPDGAD